MSFVVDTDVCSAYLRGDRRVYGRFVQHSGGLFISAITAGELHAWANRAAGGQRRRHALARMLSEVTVLPVDESIAAEFGRIRAQLLDTGVVVPVADLFIAVTALLRGYTVVTHNQKHFALVPSVRIHDWLAP